ncbi:MAG: transporter substrate-binding domain-containing protein [Verrucomicrobia bacterium]|nr:transporter substrate-binding domain-containing protein [Verrucomicrobiota bacterium]
MALPSTGGAVEAPPPARVGVLTDNYPFSFREPGGEMAGYAHDILREVERTMGLQLERVAGPTAEINGAFAGGRLDMLQSFASSPERAAVAEFSFPYVTMNGAIFVREGESRIATLADLRGRKVAVHRGSLGENILRQAGLADSILIVESVERALVMLDRGEADATLATRLTGLAQAHHFGLKRIKALPAEVPNYEVRYCIAVRKGNHALLARVNEGLAVLVRTGKFEEIHGKWFGAIEPRGYTEEQIMLAVAAGLALALAVAVWANVRQRTLRLRIQRQAEELRQSEERHRAVFEGAHDGLMVLGPADAAGDFPVEQLNPAARRLLQVAEVWPRSLTLRGLLPAEVTVHGLVARSVAQHGTVHGEHECAGSAGWWRVSVGPLGDRTLVAIADITEATEAQTLLRRQEEQMRQTQKLEAIGTLAGGGAHDFNNLLTAIMGNTELSLMTLPPAAPEAEHLRHVMQAARRARQVVKQILTFSRRTEPSREPLAVSPVLEETVSFLRSVARGAVEIEHAKAAALPAVVADAAQLHQVLMNVGTNAVQAMRSTGGTLTITEEEVDVNEEVSAQHPKLRPGRYVRIGFRDTGPGMTEQVRGRIFEPFFTTKKPGEGTGLGLSVVHGIMEQHGGAVTVYSQTGRGSLFHLYFPAMAGAAQEGLAEDRLRVPPGQGERVLFVDDDVAIGRAAGQILERLGYRVTVHARPEAAWEELMLANGGFAVVISDLTMPGHSGLELAARVRARWPQLPFILASGFFSESEAEAAETARVAHCLHKPLTTVALGRAVAKSLGRGSAAPFPVG